MRGLRYLHLYDGARSSIPEISNLVAYLRELMPLLEIDCREESRILGGLEGCARFFASVRVRDPGSPVKKEEPFPSEVEYEIRRLKDNSFRAHGIMYDGVSVAEMLSENLHEDERSLEHLHIYLTNQIMGSFDPNTSRYHAHYAIFAFPCIVSTTGMVIAPAKPREYYFAKGMAGTFAQDEIFDTMIKEGLKGRFLEDDDERLTEVTKGVILQCIFYHATGFPFCEVQSCRLFNARWQEQLLLSQTLPGAGLCKEHAGLLADIFKN